MRSRNGLLGAVATAIFVVGSGAATVSADFLPAPGSPYPTDNEPYSVSPGGFNADSLTDLAVVHGTSSTVKVFNQKAGDAGFEVAAGSPFAVGSGPNFAAVADYNGDGRDDLAVSNFLSQTVSVKLQQGSGAFTSEGVAFAVTGQPGAIASGDFNGDGKADLAVADYDHGTVVLYLRKGDNTGFVAGSSISTGGTNPRYLAVGDLDGTGAPDLAVTNSGSNTVGAILVKPGATLAASPGSPYAVGTLPQFVVIGRLDADARPDLATANYTSSNVTVLTQSATGTFAPAAGSPVAVGSQPVGLAAGDLSGSGRLDLVSANGGGGTFSVLTNTGSGFTRGEDVKVTTGGSPYGVAIGQFNSSDDVPDVAVTSLVTSPNTLSVFLNRPAPKAATTDATGVGPTTATLNGTVNPQGISAAAYFEYGTSTAYGSRVPPGGEVPAGSDRTDHPVSRTVDGLTPSTAYHYRVVGRSAGGTTPGPDRTFRTADPPAPGSGPPPPPPPPSAVSGPPQASLSAPSTIVSGTPTTLSAEGSTPAGGLTYRLDLDGSGAFATDLKTVRSLQTTFTAPGDVDVGLRVTDPQGRSDEVRRVVHVVAPTVYSLEISPKAPRAGQRVSFAVRQLVDDPRSFGPAASRPLTPGSLATMTFGDGKPVSGTVGGITVQGREASATGSFSHTFDRKGPYKLAVNVDDGKGFIQGVNTVLEVGSATGYQPAISTASTTVQQGSCVQFTNATGNQLGLDDVGTPRTRDVNPKGQIINVRPGPITFGGGINYRNLAVTPDQLVLGRTVIAGSPIGNLDLALPSALNFNLAQIRARPRTKFRQAEEVVTTDGAKACQLQTALETASAIYSPPVAKDPAWPAIPDCAGGLKLTTYSTEQKLLPDLVTQQLRTTRHTFFSLNRWSFGDGDRSGPQSYLPTASVYHPYDKGGTYNVSLSTTYPASLKSQLNDWRTDCGGRPLNATREGDERFETSGTSLKLRVLARYDRLRMRGLSLTSGTYFTETDLPGVYQSTGPIYLNTRRVGYGWNPERSRYNDADDVTRADGVLVIRPDDRPLRIVPDRGEIIGAAQLFWQAGGEQIALGPMPLKLSGTPGIVIPTATNGNQHDLGVYYDPPAKLASGPLPAKGRPFHVNAAHVILREDNGGLLELNVHMPEPLGPNGNSSDQTLVRDVRGSSRAVRPRALLDNVDVDIPPVELAPGIVSFNGGKLSHHVGQRPPWKATGSLSILTKKVDLSPDAKKVGCPVVGGLGFNEDGSLDSAGAILDGLQIPIPSPPSPPFAALANPGLQILPANAERPLDLFGCLTLQDYPSASSFQVIGCAGLLYAGSGKTIPAATKLPFCPDQNGSETFVLTDQNSTSAGPGRRTLRGVIVRVSGTLALGPGHYRVANSYLEYRDSPFAIEAKAHIGETFLGGHISITGDITGEFRAIDDWALGGEARLRQDIICVPFTDLCPGAGVALLASSRGVGGCVTIYAISVGGTIDFRDASVTPHVGDCDLADLRADLGLTSRALPTAADMLDGRVPLQALGGSQSATAQLPDGAPYAMLVVNGAGRSPVVEVRDPSGKLVLDDTGAPVQGLRKDTPVGTAPQGILHSDISTYQDDEIDLRHTTMVFVRAPKQGRYTITAKPGSSAITGVSHTTAYPEPVVRGGVSNSRTGAMLSLRSALPAGTSMVVSEEGGGISHKLTTVASGRRVRRVAVRPAVGRAGVRQVVGVVSRAGVPFRRIVLGQYRAPRAPRAGTPGRLKARLSKGALRISWAAAKNAQRYEVKVKFRRGLSLTRTVGPGTRTLALRDAMAPLGATVSVRAIGPLSTSGPAARRTLAPARVKRLRRFVL